MIEPMGSILDHSRSDIYWMRKAFKLANKAYSEKEVPVGAIVVQGNKVIGQGYNQRERLKDPTAHAEIIAITSASNTINNWRLSGCTIYVTKEPCPMCAGAIINSRIEALIFGAYDDEKGSCGSLYQLCGDKRLNSKTSVKGGIMENECAMLLKEFFKSKRS